mgnify:CR=1 FL=1|tara:strand:- start:1082 stop:3457 length:2376 start_codon:yes stop_codon:yes gene_type:complete
MKQVNYKINVTTGSSDKNIAKTNSQVDKLDKGVKSVSKSSTNLNDSFAVMPGSIGRVVQSFKALKVALLSSGIGAIVVAVGGLAGLFAAATAKGAEFAKAMSGLKAVTGATDAEIQALAHTAKELGSSTEFTAMQVAELQTELAKLGFSTSQINDMSEATLNLASSMGVSLGEAASFTGSTLRAFGLEAKDSKEVIDILAQSTASSALDFSKLNTALSTVAPIAKTANVTLTDTTAMLGTLANAGFDASTSGTALRNIFLTLSEKGLTMEEAFTKINNATDKNVVALDLFDKRGAGVAITLAENIEKTSELRQELDGATEAFDGLGAAAGIAETRLDNLEGDTTKLSSAWEGLLLSIEDGEGIFNKIARASIQWITLLVSGVTKASNFLGAFFSEINDSLSAFHLLKLGVKAAVDGIIVTFLELKKVIADIPFIGKGIDKKALQESQIAAVKSLAETTKQAAYWQDVADKRRESGRSFFERIQDRMKATALATEEEITQTTTDAETKRDEVREEMSAKELARLRKIAEEKRKLEQKALQDEEKVSEFLTRKQNTKFENELLTLMQQYDKKFELARNNAELEKQLTEQQALDLQALQDKHDKIAQDKQKAVDNKKIEDEKKLQQSKVQMSLDALGAISQLVTSFAGESEEAQKRAFNINKAINIAQAIINTAGAISAAINPAVGGLGIPAGLPGAVIAGVTGAAQVAAIARTRFESTGGGTPPPSPTGLGGGSGTGIGSQAPAFNVVGQSGFNQVAQALGQQNSTPVKAFVVSGDVTTAQALENNIIDTATF